MIPARAEGTLLDAASCSGSVTIEQLAPSTVLVLAPHPDDETFGCGMAVAAASARGISVHVVAVTAGEASHRASRDYPAAKLGSLRRMEFELALQALGHGRITHEVLGYRDGMLRTEDIPSLAGDIAAIAEREGARTIWSTWENDPHCDHQMTVGAAAQVASRLRIPLWQYAVWGRFGVRDIPESFAIYRFCDEAMRDCKLTAIGCYRSQTTNLIDDDPDGFRMPETLLHHFKETDEIFLRGKTPV